MVTHYRDYEQFKKVVLPFLLERPDTHQLILGILERGDEPLLMATAQEDDHRLVILQTIPEQAIVAGDVFSQEGIRKLARILDSPGFVGEQAILAPLLLPHSMYEVHMEQGMYALTEVEMPLVPENVVFRPISDDERQQALAFASGFLHEVETRPSERQLTQLHQSMTRHIQQGSLFGLFRGDMLVAMAAATRPTQTGITISYVYTPKELRGNGYASYLVAKLSEHLLKSYPVVTLYTDWSNQTANKIYQHVGFELVGRSLHIKKQERYR
ncbi:GCN5 family acetyltransferase [Exiguobacterium sp. Leaf187]|uniref:GCN5 family acetyltransferase n=1 Tax=Exiguobacterium indicum TaxID=296995 RepID=A0A0V8GJY8_9BACL|nr:MULTISPECIES: GNAT family N-acetyltransferase [Exiguobacterium]AHA30166.1 GCN5 family acetyltransferase [Exiguobacterium sp. MH3]KQS19408.1 GCN5 family acetyltransferase [Exiguobacterium sp. Leaf187]KSU50580.1 GCN5 family acetyltransferase [Exiguobacterium enclense]KTR26442.1 GCN5 family acetyltransferase [Exiguobacterium indicum]MCQ4089825.1 GNAT family N-acetyltransferase [Exiguobacterium sp. LL15]